MQPFSTLSGGSWACDEKGRGGMPRREPDEQVMNGLASRAHRDRGIACPEAGEGGAAPPAPRPGREAALKRPGQRLCMEGRSMTETRCAPLARPFLNTAQAAYYLGIGARKLQRLRVAGEGPRIRRHGRLIYYHPDDLDSWSRGTSAAGDGD